MNSSYKGSELLSDRGGCADAVVIVATVEFRFGADILSKKLLFDTTYAETGVAGSHFGTHGYTILKLVHSTCPNSVAPSFDI